MPPLSKVQLEWQAVVLHAVMLVAEEERERVGPWAPTKPVLDLARRCGCTHQAAIGALKSLLAAGVLNRVENAEGVFWRLTDTTTRLQEVLAPEVLLPVLTKVTVAAKEASNA